MKNTNLEKTHIDKIILSLATNEDVLSWSNGEVTKPETINYKSYKPERDGLFDELIFGPTTDYKCPICNTKYKRSDENSVCSKTTACEKYKPKILPKITRRSRMGHIHLQNPVVHFWFFKIDHSIISKLLGLKVASSNQSVTKADLEKLIYYKSHIVLDSGNLKSLNKNEIIDINDAATVYERAFVEMLSLYEPSTEEYDDIKTSLDELRTYASSKLGKDFGIDFYECNEIIHEYSDAKIGTGSQAIEYLLKNIDLEKEAESVQKEIDAINNSAITLTGAKVQDRAKLYKRLTVINSFIKSGQKPTSMLIYDLPIIPADLRPLVQLDGGRHSTSDINELYRRIIIRNNRLAKWNESDAPMLIKQNEYRMIQEAVDALIDNARKKPSPVVSKDSRPLKSISDALTGKKGRFRQNLLGKRVDYSGRSVIVVGPSLKMHQVGIPRDMAAKLFEPWIVKEIINNDEQINSIKAAKKKVESLDPMIWPYVEKAIEGRPVLLNRAPTLHRLSIQAFEPVLIRGKAIKLHPLVTTAFNADFDGDQMAVHVPISDQAVREAKELMLASKNILGPKDGEPIINPSQDMILGLYYLTMEKSGAKGEGNYYSSFDDLLTAYENQFVDLHARVVLPIASLNKKTIQKDKEAKYIVSTVGKFILNNVFPSDFEFIFGKRITVKTTTKANGEIKVSESEAIHTSTNALKEYVFGYGTDFKNFIKNLPINNPLSKKDIAKVVRKVYEKYVAVVTMEDVAEIVDKLNCDLSTTTDLFMLCAKLKDYKGDAIDTIHANSLNNLIREHHEKINYENFLKHKSSTLKEWDIYDYTKLLERVWFDYTNIVASVLDKIKNLGFKFSTLSGTTISMSDITVVKTTKKKIAEGEKYTDTLKKFFKEGYLTDDERYTLTIQKWSEIKEDIEKELKEVTKSDITNPLFMMFTSGARGNSSNFVQLAGMRGLMNNNTKVLKADAANDRVVRSTVEIPVKSSFLDGLTAYEFYSSTHGARKGLTDTALNTAKSGYLTRRLVDVAQGIVVREEDCGSDFGFKVKDIKDTKTDTVIESLKERIEGRFLNKNIYHNDKLIVSTNELITPDLATKIVDKLGIKEIEIRSVLSCHTRNGVCKKCYGKDLATNRIVNIGEAVGVVAAQSIGEPGTQLTMRTFHTGGVAGVEDITGGFGRLIELIDAYDAPWGKPAVISKYNGIVKDIKIAKDKNDKDSDTRLIFIERLNENKELVTETFASKLSQKLRVEVGQKVYVGQKLVEGPIVLTNLLEVADTRAVQNYLLKEVQRLYRLQGITISDKYIEIIIRQMLSKIMIIDPGDSHFFTGSLVDTFVYQRENGKLISQGKKPAFGEVKIRGAKQTPLLSDSFLAAASYQETAKILVNSSVSMRVDLLEGLKENIILGHKIPAGTNTSYELKGKYDIRDPKSYFTNKYDPSLAPEEDEIEKIDFDELLEESNLFDNDEINEISFDDIEEYTASTNDDFFDDFE
ncbi:DNA-directed RNA polymerase subunit beta' [Mycoplasma crocodyli]|uniref:DNA-directed RNA polymerase subunit beta' n=1 Tax=Mycoplasma crocodyli TaxID=50052 RepID=UPI0002D679BA|nr:DNA-directed RNA polymerase subunit beta' [Mycoplasma crocodyli]